MLWFLFLWMLVINNKNVRLVKYLPDKNTFLSEATLENSIRFLGLKVF